MPEDSTKSLERSAERSTERLPGTFLEFFRNFPSTTEGKARSGLSTTTEMNFRQLERNMKHVRIYEHYVGACMALNDMDGPAPEPSARVEHHVMPLFNGGAIWNREEWNGGSNVIRVHPVMRYFLHVAWEHLYPNDSNGVGMRMDMAEDELVQAYLTTRDDQTVMTARS